MALRSNGPMAGFGWLARGINLGHRNAKAVFGGAGFVVLAMLLPTLVTMPIQFAALRSGAPLSATAVVAMFGLSSVLSLLVLPAYAGYLRVIDAAERGLPARAADVFRPYRQGEVLRFMGFGLAIALLYAALLAVVVAGTGGGVARWYLQVLNSAGAQPAAVPALPPGFGVVFALLGVLWLWLMGSYAISLGQVALRGRSVAGALRDGMVGTFKNLLPLLVFAVSLIVASCLAVLCIGVAVALLALLGKVVGMWLTVVLVVPLYVALVLVMLVTMFGAMYHLWRDVCDDGVDRAPGGALAA